MSSLKHISIGGIWLVLLSCAPAGAQQAGDTPQNQQEGQQPSQPIPAIRSPLASGADNGDEDEAPNPQQVQPDTRSLTGVEDLSLGSMALEHSYWQPRLALSETVDSNPGSTSAGNGSWGTWTSLLGGVDIHRISGQSELLLSYTGGGMFSTGNSDATNGVVQELNFKAKYSFRRSTLSVFDQLSYLPESSFGFAGTAGAGLPGVGTGGGVGSGFTPGQSILTPEGQNLANASAVELDTRLSSRTSLTFVGGYSLLHYFDNNLLNYGDASFQAGYNYQISRKNTVAISYNFSAFRYSNVDQLLNLNTIQGSYARRVTGKLAFQISAGPQFASSTFPITSSTSSTATGTASTSQLYWTLNTALQYQLRRAAISASYNHGVSGGSGVLAGAETDIATGSINDRVARTFNVGFTAGYSRNKGIAVSSGSSEAQSYSYWFAGVNVAHTIGRSLDIFANYQLQYQNGNTTGCVGSTCSTNITRNQIMFGLNLHKQPIPF
ncbi:MAG: hypothetical protein WCC97_00960 [Candidatus Acidiferrales bacterium]